MSPYVGGWVGRYGDPLSLLFFTPLSRFLPVFATALFLPRFLYYAIDPLISFCTLSPITFPTRT